MKIGSIASNPNKLRLMEVLLKGETNKERIARKMRLPENTIESVLNDLIAEGFVTFSGNVYKITEDGKKALKSLKEDVGGNRK
ncbi:MAG: winged helix-turn-helix domain-containing protein [Archaeoglobaceae archaeon]|nr:winged helix-turn-helix domain-containing protein [Archaeoglobaceae archaeon]MDW8117453.1 winged helix-turn-helix domain-containing protein [Archaeoglobaceae archaeon]